MSDHAALLESARAAAQALNGVALRTPLLESLDANALLGGRLLIKAENMQRTGAFKIRGAYNRMRQLSEAERARGVITYSSGNHAQGVALAARELGSSALIVMPVDVPATKIAATQALGADVTTYDRNSETSDDVVARLSAETRRIIVPPSGDDRVLAGAGTTALELLEQARGMDAALDAVLVPCGGGGLTAATALVCRALSPETQVFAVEPELFDDTRRSLLAGRRVENPKGQSTICDAIMTPTPNAETFEVNRNLLAGALIASDDDVRKAMRFVFEHFRIVIEPGAAVGVAAVLNGQIDLRGKAVATIVTGGNIDSGRFCALLNSQPGMEGKDR